MESERTRKIVTDYVQLPADQVSATADALDLLIGRMASRKSANEEIDRAAIDEIIASIDMKMSRQVDAILHNEQFQKIESAWRSLSFLVNRTDFNQNIEVEVLNVTKAELAKDLGKRWTSSAIYDKVYQGEYNVLGGEPYGAIIGNYDINPEMDMSFLRAMANVSQDAHAPFLAAAAPNFFGKKTSFEELGKIKELRQDMKDALNLDEWKGFRQSMESRYVGLTLPRFLLRKPYREGDDKVNSFVYTEDASKDHSNYLWGNTAFALASQLTDSFAKTRWYQNVVGVRAGGKVTGLPVHVYESLGATERKIPVESVMNFDIVTELADQGFIALTPYKRNDNAAVFFDVPSARQPQTYGANEKDLETNERLGSDLGYVMILSRLAHYLKILQTNEIGRTGVTAATMQEKLQKWMNQWVSENVKDGDDELINKYPLKKAEVTVTDESGKPGWFTVKMRIMPHIKYKGAHFFLSLEGKLDKKEVQARS